MCGICGKVYLKSDRLVEAEVLNAMCKTIYFRGPDDQGTYIKGPVGLGSRRLSIIDLKGGHMPISNEDGTIWIVYNGETYNFLGLRERLVSLGHRFKTRTDTETLVHLYEEEGENFPKYLNGMFALAIWDENKRKLILARDHLGIKPLYYAHLNDRLLFGSEIKAILADGMDREVDYLALHDYLSLNYVPGPRSLLKNVKKLLPGHILILDPDSGRIKTKQYWDFPVTDLVEAKNRSPEDVEEEVLYLLRESVRDQMISDVPVGAFLSGGIDSSLLVALMSEVVNEPLKTFSIGFNERSYSELPYAKIIADRYGTEHYELVLQLDAHDLTEKIVDYFDEPFADNSAVAVYAVSKLASQHVKVVLSGDGGDEVFGGYYTYQADKLAMLYRKLPTVIGARLIPGVVGMLPPSFEKASFEFKLRRFVNSAAREPLAAHFGWKEYLTEEMKQNIYARNGCGLNGSLRPTVHLFQEYYDHYPHHDLINSMMYVDSKIQLSDDMLTKVDRMSMAHSIEVRVPLLDLRLVEFMARQPGNYKVKGMTKKYLLKKITNNLLPPEILKRPKAGFTIPVSRWLFNDLRDLLHDQLSATALKEQGFFEPQAISRMIAEQEKGKRDYSRSLWTLLMFSLWYDRYMGR